MAAAAFRFMQDTAKTAIRRVLGIRGGQGETLVPPTAVEEATRDLYLIRGIRQQQQQRLTTLCFGRLEPHSSARNVLSSDYKSIFNIDIYA